jgi:hypothetical protein
VALGTVVGSTGASETELDGAGTKQWHLKGPDLPDDGASLMGTGMTSVGVGKDPSELAPEGIRMVEGVGNSVVAGKSVVAGRSVVVGRSAVTGRSVVAGRSVTVGTASVTVGTPSVPVCTGTSPDCEGTTTGMELAADSEGTAVDGDGEAEGVGTRTGSVPAPLQCRQYTMTSLVGWHVPRQVGLDGVDPEIVVIERTARVLGRGHTESVVGRKASGLAAISCVALAADPITHGPNGEALEDIRVGLEIVERGTKPVQVSSGYTCRHSMDAKTHLSAQSALFPAATSVSMATLFSFLSQAANGSRLASPLRLSAAHLCAASHTHSWVQVELPPDESESRYLWNSKVRRELSLVAGSVIL